MSSRPLTPSRDRAPHPAQEVSPQSASRCQQHEQSHDPLLSAGTWYSTRELAAALRIDASTLRRWRTSRPPQGPPFVSMSDRVVMYSATDVEKWLHSRRTAPDRKA
ncbi:helix-turn-helix transcriptional regulator [Streptomyces laurentii]|uniref:helix-turn-helix transcriptional regulator n=1 Tax=Streptomyces laurentii TaxID=39478 RepID=UPI0036ABEFB2